MSSTRDDLQRAYQLIRNDEVEEALAILRPIVLSEPENVDAWWLLANAAVEPEEAREALVMVLRLDPLYVNANKAREMLSKLNAQHPPTDEEIARFPELSTERADEPAVETEEDLFGLGRDESFEEPIPGESASPFGDDLFEETFPAASFDVEEDPFDLDEDPFADLSDDPFALDEPIPPAAELPETRPLTPFDEPEALRDPAALAAAEEKRARQRGRGGRVVGLLVGLLLVVAVVVALAIVLPPLLETAPEDPASLSVAAVSDDQIDVIQAANAQLQSAVLPAGASSGQVVIAESSLGATLFVQICAQPSPALPQIVEQAMQIAAGQAPALQGRDDLQALGVDVSRCAADDNDTLYRAVVPVEDAASFSELQPGGPGWAEFQSRWEEA